ncbi:MAG TPA: isoaspartyl peptidase/L-asparaginase [Acidimicrobiales bacterium]|nr:isoaspartyl peptidase/L-asparaginase [Acidimicrobiales bacterium]
MILVGSANAFRAFTEGRTALLAGEPALDVVEAVIREVEDDPDDHTVGYGGFPNILGEVELDASLMEGATRRAGAVAGLRGFRHPISIAREVMDQLPHVLLVGDGAARFADECEAERIDLLTSHAEHVWRQGIEQLDGGEGALAGPLAEHVSRLVLDPEHVTGVLEPEPRTGTVNVLARDAKGDIASGASTSGWAWKYPGRAGDTGAIGAGNYCDNRYGAAACTGWGELAVRAAGAYSVVAGLRFGLTLADACAEYLRDLPDPGVGTRTVPLHVVALDANGQHIAASTRPSAMYAYWDASLAEPELRRRTHILRD